MSKEIRKHCPNCSNAIRCYTHAEYKCTKQERRVYEYAEMTECADFVKRPKGWKEMPCRCEDCLKNEMLSEED